MRGGQRDGAGRKKGSTGKNNRQMITISLPPKMVMWVNKQPLSQGKTIEQALNLLMQEGQKDG